MEKLKFCWNCLKCKQRHITPYGCRSRNSFAPFYESNYRYLHHMLHILSNMQFNQNQKWSKVLNRCRSLTHWPLAYNHVWLPTKSLPPPTPEHPEGCAFHPSNTALPRAAGMCDADGDAASEDAAPTSVSALGVPFACLVSGSTEPSASHPCHLVKQQPALTHGRSSRSTRCCSPASCAITRSGRLSTIKGGPFAFPANPSVLTIKN